MSPALRRALPFAAAFAAGVLGYLVLGAGPRASVARDTVPVDWALPADAAPDPAAAAEVWRTRSPWGANVAGADAAADDRDKAVVPVGVFITRDGLVALFSIPGVPLLRLRQGEPLPTGGQVTAVTPKSVSWTNSKGETRQRELFADPDPRGSAAPASQPTRRRRATASPQGQ